MKNLTAKEVETILNDPSTHYWVRNQALALGHMDCVDAYYDALLLAQLAKARMDIVLGRHQQEVA